MGLTLQKTYWVEVDGGSVNYQVYGKLVSKGVRFRGIIYWAFYGPAMIHLVDPDDIVRADLAPGVY